MNDMKTEGSSALDFASFWQYMSLTTSAGSNEETLKRMKAAIPGIINKRLTYMQRIYLTEYFFEGMNVREIGELHGVNKATVSRTIRRGMVRCYHGIVEVEPKMKTVEMKQRYISNKI